MTKSEQEKWRDRVRKDHPLFEQDQSFSLSLTWEEWLNLFKVAKRADERVGLLHHGFNAETGYHDEKEMARIIFYLRVAFGYRNEFLFKSESENKQENIGSIFGRMSRTEARMEVPQKAWSILCQEFFRKEKEEHNDYVWPVGWRMITESGGVKVLEKIFWFFSEESNIPRLPKDHNDRIAIEFLLSLARQVWGQGLLYSSIGKILEKNRPLLIWILWKARRLDVLLDCNWRNKVTKEDVDALKSLALYGSLSSDEEPEYNTVAESAIASRHLASNPAQIFMILDNLVKERLRQEEKRQAELELEQARQKIKQLST